MFNMTSMNWMNPYLGGMDFTSFGSFSGLSGFGNYGSIFGYGMGMDNSAAMGWGVANMLVGVAGGATCMAVQAHKTHKAEEKAEHKKLTDNVNSRSSEIKKLETENTKLNSYYNESVDDNIVALTKLFPTEAGAYKTAKKTLETATSDLNEFVGDPPTNTKYNELIKTQENNKNKENATEDEKTAADKEIAKLKAECATEYTKAKQAKIAAENAKNEAEKELKSAIKARIDENKLEIEKKQKDLDDAKSDLDELKAPANDKAVDSQFDTDDGTVFNRTKTSALSTRFDDNGELIADYDTSKAEWDFRGALSEYRSARSKNNTEQMKYWGDKALKFYDKMTNEQKYEHSISKQYLVSDKGDGNWSKKAKPLGL